VIGTGSGIVPLFPVIDALSNKPILAIALYNSYHHAGGWSGFDNRACYPLDAEGLRNPGQGDPTKSDEMSDTYLSALPWGGYSTGDHLTVGAEPTGLVHDSDKIDLGGRSLKVMHVPGREAGALRYGRPKPVVFSLATCCMTGDKVRPGHPKAPIYTTTLWRFRSLQVNVVYGGHYEPFDRHRMIGLIDGQLLDLSQYREPAMDHYAMHSPPSITSAWPVINDDRSDARKRIDSAISPVVAQRPIGMVSLTYFSIASRPPIWRM